MDARAMTPDVPLIVEINKRIRMLEGCLEVDGQLHRQGCRELLDTLRRVIREQDEVEGMRDTW
jgi:hypothetical protein